MEGGVWEVRWCGALEPSKCVTLQELEVSGVPVLFKSFMRVSLHRPDQVEQPIYD